MRLAGLRRFVAAVAALALLGSGGAQALIRCGTEAAKASCCCGKPDQSARESDRYQASDRPCCSVMPGPARREEAAPQPALGNPQPVLVSVGPAVLPLAQASAALPPPAADRPRSAGPPILLATCSFLI